jgi:hypothetical protein
MGKMTVNCQFIIIAHVRQFFPYSWSMVTWEHLQAITQTIPNVWQMTMSALPAIYERRMAT